MRFASTAYTGKTGSKNKKLPAAIKNARADEIRECLAALIAGDGTLSKNPGSRFGQAHAAYYTTSQTLCQDVAAIAVLSGFSACFRSVDRTRWKPSMLNGRSVPGGPGFVVEIGIGGTNAWFHSREITQENHQGVVSCPVTKNGIVLAERHGKIYWTGNCNSYELGLQIFNALRQTEHGPRLLFPQSSDDRDPFFQRHKLSPEPTVIISPSMTEGFDFAEDLARWQIIAKVPFPYLGDRQVAAKKEISAEWYDLQAVMAIIQACGRIVRSDSDVGQTYILDSDFLGLFERCENMFPKWWKDATVWPRNYAKTR